MLVFSPICSVGLPSSKRSTARAIQCAGNLGLLERAVDVRHQDEVARMPVDQEQRRAEVRLDSQFVLLAGRYQICQRMPIRAWCSQGSPKVALLSPPLVFMETLASSRYWAR